MDSIITCLADLQKYRSAPNLDKHQEKLLFKELHKLMKDADWFTIGIMAPTYTRAIYTLQEMEKCFSWQPMSIKSRPETINTPVFLKANQNTGDIYIRTEYNLGEGILLTCQHYEEIKEADTIGPLPLEFFKSKD